MKPARLKALIGANVKATRERRGLSQEKLAEAIDRTWQSISHIETGKTLPPLGTLAALATALGVPMGALLAEDGVPASDRRNDLMTQAHTALDDLTDDQLQTALRMLSVLREAFGRG